MVHGGEEPPAAEAERHLSPASGTGPEHTTNSGGECRDNGARSGRKYTRKYRWGPQVGGGNPGARQTIAKTCGSWVTSAAPPRRRLCQTQRPRASIRSCLVKREGWEGQPATNPSRPLLDRIRPKTTPPTPLSSGSGSRFYALLYALAKGWTAWDPRCHSVEIMPKSAGQTHANGKNRADAKGKYRNREEGKWWKVAQITIVDSWQG